VILSEEGDIAGLAKQSRIETPGVHDGKSLHDVRRKFGECSLDNIRVWDVQGRRQTMKYCGGSSCVGSRGKFGVAENVPIDDFVLICVSINLALACQYVNLRPGAR
jgi:hypothetical protein